MDPSERAKMMMRFADLIEKNAPELAALESINNGKPYSVSLAGDLVGTHRCIRYYGGWV